MKSKVTLKNIFYYIQGNIRYYIYYSKYFKWLMRSHIRQQIDCRIWIMDRTCYNTGSCKECGCSTTALQMANKECGKPCYAPIVGKKTWEKLCSGERVMIGNDKWAVVSGATACVIYKNGKKVNSRRYNE